VCELIIDGGSCSNVASMTLIDKLQSPTKVHHTPYTLQWLKQRSEVIISIQALIAFSVGLYCDEVLCDVLLMDACHLLPGRPWLFHNHVIYDGLANTDEFKQKGRSLTLIPLPLHKSLIFKLGRGSEKFLHVSETCVVKAIGKSKPLFALLVMESNTYEEVKPMHPLAPSLLREFVDVFPNDFLLRLPPLRGNEHQIDLLLGAPLPNKLAYRCNPNESKELH